METAVAEAAAAAAARDAAQQRLTVAEQEGERVARLIPQYRTLLVKAKVDNRPYHSHLATPRVSARVSVSWTSVLSAGGGSALVCVYWSGVFAVSTT